MNTAMLSFIQVFFHSFPWYFVAFSVQDLQFFCWIHFQEFYFFKYASMQTYFLNFVFGLFIAGERKGNFVDSLRFSIYKMMSSAKRGIFTPSFPTQTGFAPFSCLIVLTAFDSTPSDWLVRSLRQTLCSIYLVIAPSLLQDLSAMNAWQMDVSTSE